VPLVSATPVLHTLPSLLELDAPAPNPFNPTTTIRYALPRAASVDVSIYDAAGRRIASLVNGWQPAGPHQELWDGRDALGQPASSGVYFVRLESAGEKRVPFTLSFPFDDFEALLARLRDESNGIGLPEGFVPHSTFWLVRDGKEVQDEGVLEMKCGALMTHYHKLPKTTARVMTPDGYYRTSDVFRRDENGFFYFVGRVDDMFVCGGENIYPGEVEKMLEKHPAIHQAAVIAVPDELKGHKPVAFVVRANGAALDEQAVKSYALANAPAYQHPRRVFFVDEMPLAGTNKIDKRVLAKQIPEGMEI